MDITKRPKTEPKPAMATPKRHLVTSTLRNLLTDNENATHLLKCLTDMAKIKPNGPWREYLAFYQQNQSGDVTTMKPEVKKYVDKMVKEVKDAYFQNQVE